jgi:hypothetical protein
MLDRLLAIWYRERHMKKRGSDRTAPGKFQRMDGVREKGDNSAFGS